MDVYINMRVWYVVKVYILKMMGWQMCTCDTVPCSGDFYTNSIPGGIMLSLAFSLAEPAAALRWMGENKESS